MVTAKALAAELGISIATVSRALNGKPGLSPSLRKKILAEAAIRHTVINPVARMLATSKSENVCFAVYHLAGPVSKDPFYFPILMGLEEETRQVGLQLSIAVISEDDVKDAALWRVISERRADGVILNGPFVPASFILKLHSIGIPVVLVDNFNEHLPVDAVVAADKSGASEAAKHIISLGHKKVAILSGPKDWYSNAERCAGFISAFANKGLEIPEIFYGDDTTYENGVKLFKKAIKKSPTAVISVNDAMALGAMDAATEMGYSIPQDISFTGFDDIESARTSRIPLTTVSVPREFLGRAAGRLFWSRIDDPSAPRQRIEIETKLVIRNSTQAAKRLKLVKNA
jgi:DNA-binding LacI/PurR family transcriptional regulator